MRLRGYLVCTVSIGFLYCASGVAAHPGGLDKDGCHHVHTRWVAKDGTVYEPGEHHCHRKLGEMKLDGKERLQEPSPPPAPDDQTTNLPQPFRLPPR